ncbi:MAG: GTPase Era [Coriobacteriales bacterium]|jgi:GTP-binding protein Era
MAEQNTENAPAEEFRSGFVTLAGRPNAGKSTLLNAVMGEKIAITSSVPQTTRHRFRAVYDTDDMQMILVDTPGIHKPHDPLGEELNYSAIQGIHDVDVVAFLLDASKPVGKGDIFVLNQLAEVDCSKILVVNKADLVSQHESELQVVRASRHLDFDDVVVCSALKGFNVDGFIAAVRELLPEGPRWFPKGIGTDQPTEVIVAEFIREKILRSTYDEVPHAVGVLVDEMEYSEKKDIYRIYASIFVDRDSQKGIIIGSKGENIKRIGTEARIDLEHFLGSKVHLELKVKVKRHWRNDAAQIRRFGYGEGL